MWFVHSVQYSQNSSVSIIPIYACVNAKWGKMWVSMDLWVGFMFSTNAAHQRLALNCIAKTIYKR